MPERLALVPRVTETAEVADAKDRISTEVTLVNEVSINAVTVPKNDSVSVPPPPATVVELLKAKSDWTENMSADLVPVLREPTEVIEMLAIETVGVGVEESGTKMNEENQSFIAEVMLSPHSSNTDLVGLL